MKIERHVLKVLEVEGKARTARSELEKELEGMLGQTLQIAGGWYQVRRLRSGNAGLVRTAAPKGAQ